MSMGIGSFVGFISARQWYFNNYNEKLKIWSEKLTKLSKQVVDAQNRYAQKEKELIEKYEEKK
jgi:hypothetical protein